MYKKNKKRPTVDYTVDYKEDSKEEVNPG